MTNTKDKSNDPCGKHPIVKEFTCGPPHNVNVEGKKGFSKQI
jgi:hypothetical protein